MVSFISKTMAKEIRGIRVKRFIPQTRFIRSHEICATLTTEILK